MKSLLICSSEKELHLLKQYVSNKYSIGTINFAFYMKCRDNGEDAEMLEYDGLMPKEETWEILKVINAVIESCKIRNDYLYTFSYHIESGLPYQIAMIIAYINLLEHTMQEKQIEKVYMIDNKENWIVNEAVFLYCQDKEIACTICSDTDGGIKLCLYTLRNSKYGKRKYLEEWKAQVKRVQELYRRKREKVRYHQQDYDIGCIYPIINNAKHLSWILNETRLFKEKFSVQIMAFYHSDDIKRLEQEGYSVDCIEDYFAPDTFWKDILEHFKTIHRIEKRLKDKLEVAYKDIDMKAYLCRKIMNYLQRDSVEYFYIDHCLKEYFKCHTYRYIRAWGNSNFWQTKVVHEHANRSKFFCFRLNVVAYLKMYEPDQDIIDITFYPNEVMKEYYEYMGYQRISYAGYDFINADKFYQNMSVQMSRKNRKIMVLVALSYPFLGLSTYKFFEETLYTIVKELSDTECSIMIKNHPNMQDEIEEKLVKNYITNTKLKVVEKHKAIQEVLELSDIVITDISNVIFDAGIAQKMVYCITGEKQYSMVKHLEQGFKVFMSAEEACNDIRKLTDQKNDLEIERIVKRQNEYLKSFFGNYTEETKKKILEVCSSELTNEQDKNLSVLGRY